MENSNAMDNKADAGVGIHDSITIADYDRFDKSRDSLKISSSLLISPKCADNQVNKETEKSPKSNRQISKRMRTTDSSNIIKGCCSSYILGKVSTVAKCTSVQHGKSRAMKQKNIQDNRRADTKMFKVSMKSRCVSLASKASSVNSTFVGKKSILGIYGLKSDVHCHLKQAEDPSLSELLDGSYKWCASCHDKEKKVSATGGNILHSIKRALSFFPPVAEPENSTDPDDMTKVQLCQLESLSREQKTADTCFNNLASSNEEHTNLFQLYQPRDVFERLTLTSTCNLDELILDTTPFTAPQKKSPNSEFENSPSDNVHLPTFPWSLPLIFPSKPNIDFGKSTRSVSQGRWARIGMNFSVYGNSYNFYPDLCSLYDTVPHKQLKIHIDSENGKSMTTENASYNQQFDASFDKNHSGIHSFSDKVRPEVDKFSHRFDSSCVERFVEYSDSTKPDVEHNFSPRQRFEAGENVDEHTTVSTSKLQPCFLDTETGNIQIPIDHHGIKIFACSSSGYLLKRTSIGHGKVLQNSCTMENSVQDNPPVVVAAAQILWELANSTRSSTGKQVQNPGYNKWSKKPLQKTMRTGNMNPSMRKLETEDTTPLVVGDFNVTGQEIFKSSKTEKETIVSRKHNHPKGTIGSHVTTSRNFQAMERKNLPVGWYHLPMQFISNKSGDKAPMIRKSPENGFYEVSEVTWDKKNSKN